MNLHHVVLFGPPGSGKGTQAAILAQSTGMRHVATGDLLRSHIARGTSLGTIAAAAQRNGAYVDDAIMNAMIEGEVASASTIIDGYPRTIAQARALDAMVDGAGLICLNVVVERNELVRRIAGRLVHPGSGRTYHETLRPPRVPGRDDESGEALVRRPDDAEHLVEARLDLYEEKIAEVLAHYGSAIIHVDGGREASCVAQEIAEMVGRLRAATTREARHA